MAKLEEVARKVAEEAKQDKPTKLQFVRLEIQTVHAGYSMLVLHNIPVL